MLPVSQFCNQISIEFININFVVLTLLLFRFLRNPTELKSIKNISLLRQQPAPQPAKLLDSATSTSTAQVSNTHQLPSHLNQQVPPSSPRVHALNGAFHYLSTSTLSERGSPQSSSSQQNASNSSIDFKREPSVEMDELPTDLSTGGDRRSNADCYP